MKAGSLVVLLLSMLLLVVIMVPIYAGFSVLVPWLLPLFIGTGIPMFM